MKSIPELTDCDPFDLESWVQVWWEAADCGREFHEVWIDFHRAWDRVQFLEGEAAIIQLYQQALDRPLPRELKSFGEPIQKLGRLCAELHRASGGVFFLSTRMAAKLIVGESYKDGDQMKAWRWLWFLERSKLLTTVSKGTRRDKQASTYRWNGSLPE